MLVSYIPVLVVDHGKGGEAVAHAELAAPARGNGVVAESLGEAVVARGAHVAVAQGDEVDWSFGEALGVDGEVDGALVVLGVAVADDALEGGFGDIRRGHHGHLHGGGGANHGGGGEEGGNDDLREMHGGGCICWASFLFL